MSYRSVQVELVEGRNLAAVDHGSADPFVRVSIGDNRKLVAETPHLVRTVNPVWNCKVRSSSSRPMTTSDEHAHAHFLLPSS